MAFSRDALEPCAEVFDIGPFRFECAGHLPRARERAVLYHDGKLTHQSTSRQDVGDVDVTFWTIVTRGDL